MLPEAPGQGRRQDLCLEGQGQALAKADLTIGARDRAPATSRSKRPGRRRHRAAPPGLEPEGWPEGRDGRQAKRGQRRQSGRPPKNKRKYAMFLSNFSVKKPIATIVLIIAMMCLGLLALKKLRVNQNPDVECRSSSSAFRIRAPRRRRSSARSSTASKSDAERSPA
jgi:hypothetical protein